VTLQNRAVASLVRGDPALEPQAAECSTSNNNTVQCTEYGVQVRDSTQVGYQRAGLTLLHRDKSVDGAFRGRYGD
jgi:hypothetical protein